MSPILRTRYIKSVIPSARRYFPPAHFTVSFLDPQKTFIKSLTPYHYKLHLPSIQMTSLSWQSILLVNSQIKKRTQNHWYDLYYVSVVQRHAGYFTSSHPKLPNWVTVLDFKISQICLILSSCLEPHGYSPTEHKFN